MQAGVISFAIGSIGLSIALAVSYALVRARAGTQCWRVNSLSPILALAIGMHVVHLSEETIFGFSERFPTLLGLAPWPLWLFLSFNGGLLILWAAGLSKSVHGRPFAVAYWFLALASILNGLAHPALAIASSGYFPGLATSPIVAILGVLLLRRLYRGTQDA